MIQLRHQERSLWEGLFAEEVAELWEPWMSVVDELLARIIREYIASAQSWVQIGL